MIGRGVAAVVVGVLGALIVLAARPAAALAHGDVRLVDGEIVVAPGGTARFAGALHYHRLVGRIAADGPLVVRLVESDTGRRQMEEGPGDAFALNRLIRCCDDRAWTPHELVIENRSERPVTADARVGLVHDDLAVMVYRAESGVTESVVVLGGIWAAVVWRGVRRPPAAARWRRAVVAFAVLVTVVVGLAWYGAARYGMVGAPAFVAALSEVRVVPPNPIMSQATLLTMAALFGWGLAGAWWVRAAAGGVAWLGLGLLLAGAVVVVAISIVSEYGSAAMPVACAIVAAGPVLAAFARMRAVGIDTLDG